MPQSRKRQGHPFQKPSDIPAKQRTKATTVCAILFAVFAGIIAFFANADYIYIGLAVVIGAVARYYVGRALERDAKSTG